MSKQLRKIIAKSRIKYMHHWFTVRLVSFLRYAVKDIFMVWLTYPMRFCPDKHSLKSVAWKYLGHSTVDFF